MSFSLIKIQSNIKENNNDIKLITGKLWHFDKYFLDKLYYFWSTGMGMGVKRSSMFFRRSAIVCGLFGQRNCWIYFIELVFCYLIRFFYRMLALRIKRTWTTKTMIALRYLFLSDKLIILFMEFCVVWINIRPFNQGLKVR